MAGIHEYLGLRTGGLRQHQRHAPIGDIGVIEGGLEGLILDQHALSAGQGGVGLLQAFGEPAAAMAHVLRAGVIGAVGKPEGQIAAAQLLLDLHAIQNVIHGFLADGRIGIADGAVLVVLILKYVGIDGAGPESVFGSHGLYIGAIGGAVGKVPQHVERNRRADARQPMHLTGIGELVLSGRGRGGLEEFAEAGTRVGETPGRQFDMERV